MIFLCGDIGASNSRLAIVEIHEQKLQFHVKEFLENSDFQNFHETLAAFQKKHSLKIDGACFGVAGPVHLGQVEITNLPWVITETGTADFLKVKNCFLINDLHAIAYGVRLLEKSDCVEILPGRAAQGTQAIVAPGSGIGEAILFWDGTKHHPMPTEGGHSSYSPTSSLQVELLQYLFQSFTHVSWERVLSGPGILNIYQFLKDTKKASGKFPIQTSAQISEGALKGDALCLKTIDLFFEILATEAGNLALKTLPFGGLYIAGGITPKLLNFLNLGEFKKNFLHKGRMSELLEDIRVTLILNDDVGIRGAAAYALLKAD